MCPNEEGRRENEQRVDAGAGDRKGKKEPAKHRAGKQPRYRTKKAGAIASGASRAGFGYEQQERGERDERQSAGCQERRPPADIVAHPATERQSEHRSRRYGDHEEAECRPSPFRWDQPRNQRVRRWSTSSATDSDPEPRHRQFAEASHKPPKARQKRHKN